MARSPEEVQALLDKVGKVARQVVDQAAHDGGPISSYEPGEFERFGFTNYPFSTDGKLPDANIRRSTERRSDGTIELSKVETAIPHTDSSSTDSRTDHASVDFKNGKVTRVVVNDRYSDIHPFGRREATDAIKTLRRASRERSESVKAGRANAGRG